MKKFIIATLLLPGFIHSSAFAQELEPVQQPKKLSFLKDMADDIDNFLSGDDEIVTGPNETRLVLGQRLVWEEGGMWDYSIDADLRLHLPKFAEKWRLRFTTYDTDEEEVGLKKSQARTQERTEDAGLSIFFLSQFKTIQITFRPRLNGDGVSHVLRFKRPSDFWMFKFKPKLELFARPDEGTGQFLALNMGYHINHSWLFTLINEEQYTDIDNTMATNQGFAFRHIHDENTTQYYALIFESSNQPHYRLDKYTLSTTYEHYFKDRTMVYRLIPSIIWARVNEFEGNPVMTFEFDYIF